MIRILIADDHRLVRVALRQIIERQKIGEVVADVESGEQAVEECRAKSPHVALMDLHMHGIGGLEATRRIVRLDNGCRVVVLTGSVDEPYPSQALKAGATGYVTKQSTLEDVITGIKRAFVGKRYVSPDIAQQLAFKSFGEASNCPFDQLSNREMQITLMVINCHRVHEISENLHLSPKTVNSYRYRIFEKAGRVQRRGARSAGGALRDDQSSGIECGRLSTSPFGRTVTHAHVWPQVWSSCDRVFPTITARR